MWLYFLQGIGYGFAAAAQPGPLQTYLITLALTKSWHETPIYGMGFIAGFYITMLASLCAIILVFGLAKQIGPRVNRALLGVSAIALFFFGIYQLWQGILTLG